MGSMRELNASTLFRFLYPAREHSEWRDAPVASQKGAVIGQIIDVICRRDWDGLVEVDCGTHIDLEWLHYFIAVNKFHAFQNLLVLIYPAPSLIWLFYLSGNSTCYRNLSENLLFTNYHFHRKRANLCEGAHLETFFSNNNWERYNVIANFENDSSRTTKGTCTYC